MAQLSFDYDGRSNEQVAYYAGDVETAPYRVRMVQDESPENPFTSWDGHWPMIVDYQDRGHRFDEYDNAPGVALDRPLQRFTDGQLIRHQHAILKALGGNDARYYNTLTGDYSANLIDQFARDVADYRSDYHSMADCKRDLLEQAFDAISDGDKLETIAALYTILGIPALCTSSQGYSQGDYAELLIVATPEAMTQFGWNAAMRCDKAKIAADMQAQAKLYGYWAWGDVYGYIAERAPTDPEERDDSDAWEEIDSCWGFYGDASESGLADAALAAIEHDARERKQAHFGKLKELIRASVPLQVRAEIMRQLPLTEGS